jgi:hypothetical protein
MSDQWPRPDDFDHRIWNVMWSQQQNCFHIERMEETIADGMEALKGDVERQYILVATGLTRDESEAFTARWRDILHVRGIAIVAKRDSPFDGAI